MTDKKKGRHKPKDAAPAVCQESPFSQRFPVAFFFRSLAQDQRERARSS